MLSELPTSATEVGHTIQLAVAPIFLLAGVGAFLNVCAGRLSRIVDRARGLEIQILKSRGKEHDRLVGEIRILDRRMVLVSRAIFLSVLSALLTCSVVALLFAADLAELEVGTPIALLFIAAMASVAAAFAVFLIETRLGSRAVRISTDILQHQASAEED